MHIYILLNALLSNSKLPKINDKSWGGRESVGGSPRGEIFPKELLEEVLDIVDGCRMVRI